MRGKEAAAAVCLVALVVAAAGAAPPPGSVATVGGERVTVEDIRKELSLPDLKHETMGMASTAAAGEALERIVRRRLVERDVKTRKLLDGPLGDRYQAMVIPAIARIYRRVRLGEIVVTDADLQDQLNVGRMERRRVSYIVTSDPEAMREVRRRLASGESFADLARKFSEGPATEKGGDLGWLEKGAKKYFVDEQWDEIFSLPKGGLTGVYPSILFEQAEAIARVEAIESYATGEIEKIKKAAREALRDQRFADELAKMQRDAKLALREDALPRLAVSDRLDVLATFTGGKVTAGLLRAYCDLVQVDYRKADVATLAAQLKGLAEQAVIAAKKKDALLSRPGSGDGARLGMSNALIRVYFEELFSKLAPTEQELVQYYREHPEQNRRAEKVNLMEIRCASRQEAEEAAERLKKGEEFETVAALFARTDEERRRAGLGGMLSRGTVFPPQVDDVIFALPLMKPSAPVESRLGWHIFMVRSNEAAKEMKFEERVGAIRAELLKQQQERLFRDTLTRLRDKFPIEIDRAALEKL